MSFLARLDPEREVKWGTNRFGELVLEGWDRDLLVWFVEFGGNREVIVHTRSEPSDRFKQAMLFQYAGRMITYCDMGLYERKDPRPRWDVDDKVYIPKQYLKKH